MLLFTVKSIALYCHRTERTIFYWVNEFGFPMGKLPNGQCAVSTVAIDEWLMNRHLVLRKYRKKANDG